MQSKLSDPQKDDNNLPVYVTATMAVVLMVVVMWLFVPGRTATVRARMQEGAETGTTAPPAAVRQPAAKRQSDIPLPPADQAIRQPGG